MKGYRFIPCWRLCKAGDYPRKYDRLEQKLRASGWRYHIDYDGWFKAE